MSDYKNRVKKAIDGYYRRQKIDDVPKRKNQKPEKELVEKPCLAWLRNNGFRCKIIEAKAVWSKNRNCYTNSHVAAGTLDCQIVTPDGFAGWIEFKAPGKLNTIHRNPRQLQTLRAEISFGCFACVVDSVELLKSIYFQWIHLKHNGCANEATDYLLSLIPDEPKRRDDDASLF